MRPQEIARHPAVDASGPELGDLRFRALLAETEWGELSTAVRSRFSRRLAGGRTLVYVGEILVTRISRLGWLLAQAARLIGAPLPTHCDVHVPAVVSVTEDMASGGQIWTRLYTRRNGFPQVIHSSKRFAGPTGLEEHVGYGIGMALTVHVERRALIFRSHHYFVQLFRMRLRLPSWLAPGALSVAHAERDDDAFMFTLDVVHPAFGELIHQSGLFREIRT